MGLRHLIFGTFSEQGRTRPRALTSLAQGAFGFFDR